MHQPPVLGVLTDMSPVCQRALAALAQTIMQASGDLQQHARCSQGSHLIACQPDLPRPAACGTSSGGRDRAARGFKCIYVFHSKCSSALAQSRLDDRCHQDGICILRNAAEQSLKVEAAARSASEQLAEPSRRAGLLAALKQAALSNPDLARELCSIAAPNQ
ncbi:hypothetical protein WJX74_007821 [Apatococcus lobatus]|uniref:Uncharacterized protein n=1 Tax=Apatococcus lobatus TaxID=904363 RepID=A0AAW1S096_9CHLO